MWARSFFPARFFAPDFWAGFGAIPPPPEDLVPLFYRRRVWQDEWSLDGATWFEARHRRALFQSYIVADLGDGEQRHNIWRIYGVWYIVPPAE